MRNTTIITILDKPARAPRTVGVVAVAAHLPEGEGTANPGTGKTLPAFGIAGFTADSGQFSAACKLRSFTNVGLLIGD
jgi:hypothetical protein